MSMTKAEQKNKELVVKFMHITALTNGKQVSLSEIEKVANRLHRLETSLSRLAEDQCNYPVYDSAKQKRLEKLALKIIEENVGCKAYIQRDPRGYIIRMYLQDEDGRKWFNSWDGETTGLNW